MEKFKKERISLDYTVMLVPHSQKKPIHFKTPVWTFGVIFLGLLVLTGTCLFFAGSRHQLTQVRREKEQLEQEWERLAEQKQLADQENEILRQEQQIQKQELEELEERTKNTLKELEDLVEREGQIRQELGLEDIRPDEAGDVDGSDGAGSADSLAGDADSLDGRAGHMDSPDGAGAEMETVWIRPETEIRIPLQPPTEEFRLPPRICLLYWLKTRRIFAPFRRSLGPCRICSQKRQASMKDI